MSQRLVAVGPNLPRPLCDQGTVHFHAEGCAHLSRRPLRDHLERDSFATEYASIKEVVCDWYPPDNFDYDENDPEQYAGYRSDIYFAPCVKLPEEVVPA